MVWQRACSSYPNAPGRQPSELQAYVLVDSASLLGQALSAVLVVSSSGFPDVDSCGG